MYKCNSGSDSDSSCNDSHNSSCNSDDDHYSDNFAHLYIQE